MKPTKRIEFKPKDLILDNYGRVCIVIKQDGRPGYAWLLGQDDKRVRDALGDAVLIGWTPPRWWQWWRRNDTKVP